MAKICKMIIRDEVNVTFEGLDASTRRKCVNAVKYFIPQAQYLPAFKLGHWDGTTSFFALNGNTYFNVLDRILPVVIQENYIIEEVDHRRKYEFEFEPVDENFLYSSIGAVWPIKHPSAGQPIRLRDYQVNIVNTFLENPNSIYVAATGSGKTITTATLSYCVEKYGRSIVIVPNKSLVVQTEADYKLLGLDVGVFYGDRKEPGHKHTICTWQSVNEVLKRTKAGTVKKGDVDIDTFLENVICVISDECHQIKGAVLKELLCGPFAHIPIRWGLTGTIPKEDHEAMCLYTSIGNVVGKLTASELQEKDVLAKCHIECLQLQDTQEFKTYPEEVKWLTADMERLGWIAKTIKDISKTGNTLVLCNYVETGKLLEQLIPGNTFLSGSTKLKVRSEHYDGIADSHDTILTATYGIAAVGLNIPRIFNLVLLEPGKSFVRVIQSIGRGIRKAEDKDFVQIWDITSSCKYSSKHLTKRKAFYKEANYPFNVRKIDWRKNG
jgi:superfamily II DNA or RNA helicase